MPCGVAGDECGYLVNQIIHIEAEVDVLQALLWLALRKCDDLVQDVGRLKALGVKGDAVGAVPPVHLAPGRGIRNLRF